MGRDRGKFNKRGGGAGKGFDAISAEEIEVRNRQLAEQEERRAQRRAGEDSDDDDDEDGDKKDDKEDGKKEEQVEEEAAQVPEVKVEVEKKPKGEGAPVVTSAYEHKKNMAKLEEVRRRREEAAARRAIEEEAQKEAEEEQKRMAAMTIGEANDSDDDDKKKKKKGKGKEALPKLDKITIKKMKPAQLKESLKARNLEIQGNAKELMDRLLKYEAER
jgi:hypothetical protein